MKFSPKVSALYESIKETSHPECPFLSKVYSTGSHVVCNDFTEWMQARVFENDWQSIYELLTYTNYDHEASALVKTFSILHFPEFENDKEIHNALISIALLHYRKDQNTQNVISNLSTFYAVILAENNFTYKGNNHTPIKFAQEIKPFPLPLKVAIYRAIIRAWDVETMPEDFKQNLSISQKRQGFGVILLSNWLFDNHYGCLDDYSEYIKTIVEQPEIEFILLNLKKERLLEVASTVGVELKKSWNKEKMVESLKDNAKAVELLKDSPSHWVTNSLKLKDKEAAFEWVKDVDRILDIASELANIKVSVAPLCSEYASPEFTQNKIELYNFYQLVMDQGRGKHDYDSNIEMQDMYPYLELEVNDDEKLKLWKNRWTSKGGKLIKQRMIAEVSSDIWLKLSDFGYPYNPFIIDEVEMRHRIFINSLCDEDVEDIMPKTKLKTSKSKTAIDDTIDVSIQIDQENCTSKSIHNDTEKLKISTPSVKSSIKRNVNLPSSTNQTGCTSMLILTFIFFFFLK